MTDLRGYYACHLCTVEPFFVKSLLDQHIRQHHPEETPMTAPEYLDPVRDELHQLRATLARVEALPSWAACDIDPTAAVILAADLTDALADKEPTP